MNDMCNQNKSMEMAVCEYHIVYVSRMQRSNVLLS